MTALPKLSVSVEAYLAHERASTDKHEYYAHEMFAMAGGSEAHNLITANIVASLHSQLRRQPCRVYPSDMRVKVTRTTLYTYPDATVVCGQPAFEDDHQDTLLNPTIVVEILSPSTEKYDRGKRAQNYRTIPSLQEYLLVAQDTRQVEHYVRQADNQWLLSEFTQDADTIPLPAIACVLSLADVYEKVTLDPEQ